MQNRVPTQTPVLDFTPVPRKYRVDGWTPERQRAFIAALAETGSVKAAAKRINMSPEGAYCLRRQPHAESFRAAWQAAIDHGVQCLVDIAIDRAREGVVVPIYYRGEQCGEKRWYNDRLLMFLLKHHLPGRYGTPALAHGTRHPDTVAREAAENCPVCREEREQREAEEAALRDPDADLTPGQDACLDEIFARYAAKVQGERNLRRSGEIVAADFTVRQLTHIELVLVAGDRAHQLIEFWTKRQTEWGQEELIACPISELLDDLRRQAWEAAGEPARPPLPHCETGPGVTLFGGSDWMERDDARRAAEQRMAEAQAEWEAAAREDTWAEWKALRYSKDAR